MSRSVVRRRSMDKRPRLGESEVASSRDRPDSPGPLTLCVPQSAGRNFAARCRLGCPCEEQPLVVVVRELGDFADHIARWARLPTKSTKPLTVAGTWKLACDWRQKPRRDREGTSLFILC